MQRYDKHFEFTLLIYYDFTPRLLHKKSKESIVLCQTFSTFAKN